MGQFGKLDPGFAAADRVLEFERQILHRRGHQHAQLLHQLPHQLRRQHAQRTL